MSNLRDLKVVRTRSIGGTHPEARQHRNEILVSDKFFELPEKSRLHVLLHEIGHWFRQENLSLSDIMGWEEGDNFFGVFSTFDSEEGFAEAFAVYHLEPRELEKRRPDLKEKLDTWVGPSLRYDHWEWAKARLEDLKPRKEVRIASRWIKSKLSILPLSKTSSVDYESVVAAVLTDSDIVSEVIEDMVSSDRLQIRGGEVYYKDRRIL